MLKGSCLCGSIRYEVNALEAPIIHCHCQTCRKAHSAAFSTLMPVPRDAFRWVEGESQLTSFESSPGKFRKFCSRCGSHLMADRPDQPVVLLRLGCLDSKLTNRPKASIWRSDGADWFDPSAPTMEFPEGIPTS
ncbi:MAG TPA: GFA family protein [Henriciella marina]|uniref:GFA family protein n=1 Tax=Henriciella sp. TaxID=1968823 RepID=UPI00182D31E0|nr:GFA family protein [Henriciella sp.]HIK66079.1 GFA family protein [Henriciella marina]